MFFDARAAKLLQPGDHLVVDGCPGLRLVVSATRKTWVYRYKAVADGRMKQVSLGQWPAMSVQSAAAAWQVQRDGRSSGLDPVAQRRAVKKSAQSASDLYRVRALVMDYIDGHIDASRKAAGALAARRSLERLMEEDPEFAARPAHSITRADAFDLIDSRKTTPTAAAKLRSMLGSAWDYALDAGRLEGDVPNWWRVVMKGRLKSKGKIIGGEHVGKTRRVLQPAEVGALLIWLPNMHALGRDVTQMYLWTCARGGEILGMRPEHISSEADGWWWTVPKSETKNARMAEAVDLRVPLVGRALEIVQLRMARVGVSGLLFEDAREEQYTQKDFSTYIYSLQPYSEKAQRRQSEGLICPVTHWTPHNLRRTARTLLASLGCLNEIAEAIIGHMPEEIVGTYNAYTYDTERRHWLGKLDAHLEELAAEAAAGLPARP